MVPALLLVGSVFVATIAAVKRWRSGIYLAILAGMLQDPVRKMTPGTPALMVLASVPIWIAVYIGVLREAGGARMALRRDYPRLSSAATLFAASLLIPAILSFQYGFEGWQLAVLGLFGYLSPLFGVLVGFAFPRGIADVRRLLVFYVLASAVMLLGTGLEYIHAFPGWAAVGTEALGARWIRTTSGDAVDLHSGFFRSPDIMGWHAATAVMLGLALMLQRRMGRDRLWAFVAVWGGLCLLLAGRRKMTMMPVVWAACMVMALVGSGRLRRAAALGLAGLAVAASIYYASGELDVHQGYYVYAGSAASEGSGRVIDEAWDSVWGTYGQAGFLGRGLGSASQGARYLTVSAQSWQEGGPSKIMAELGVPGFLCSLLLLWRLGSALRASMRVAISSRAGGSFGLALISFVIANAVCFTISHQAYSDAVILTLTSLILGTALGTHRWATASEARPVSVPTTAWALRTSPTPIGQAR